MPGQQVRRAGCVRGTKGNRRHSGAQRPGGQQMPTWRVRVGAAQLGKLLEAHRPVLQALQRLDLLLARSWRVDRGRRSPQAACRVHLRPAATARTVCRASAAHRQRRGGRPLGLPPVDDRLQPRQRHLQRRRGGGGGGGDGRSMRVQREASRRGASPMAAPPASALVRASGARLVEGPGQDQHLVGGGKHDGGLCRQEGGRTRSGGH